VGASSPQSVQWIWALAAVVKPTVKEMRLGSRRRTRNVSVSPSEMFLPESGMEGWRVRRYSAPMGQECRPEGHTSDCVHRMGLAVACMTARGLTDGDESPKAQKMADRILEFTLEAGLAASFDAGEMGMLQAPAGSWSPAERNQARWLAQGIAVLAWTLGQAELPASGVRCQAAPVSLALGLFRPGMREQIGAWEMRGLEEILPWAAHYFALNWRLHQYLAKPEKFDFAGLLRDPKWQRSVRDGIELADGDLTIDGRPLQQVGQERLYEVFAIVRERCKAFRWLTGYDKSYATVTRVH